MLRFFCLKTLCLTGVFLSSALFLSLSASEALKTSTPPIDLQVSNTVLWREFFEKSSESLGSGEDPGEALKLCDALIDHFSKMKAEIVLSNPTHYADLQAIGELRLNFLFHKAAQALEKEWSKQVYEDLLKRMVELGSPLEDRLGLLRHLKKDRDYLKALRKVFEQWERFPEKMQRPRPIPLNLTFRKSWGRNECYDALAILDLAFKSNWKPEVKAWEEIALPLGKTFISMGLPRYAKDLLDLHPEGDLSDSLKEMRVKVDAQLENSGVQTSDGSDLY